MALKLTDLNASKPTGSGAGAEGVETADNYLRLIQQVILDTFGVFSNADGSPKFPVGYQDQRATVLPSPADYVQFLNATRGVLSARLPAAGLTYAVGNYKTNANPATTAVLTGNLTKWSTNLLPGMKFVGYGGGVNTIKSIEGETSMTLTTVPAAGDSWEADFTKTYTVRMLFDALQWLDMFPIFAVTRPDGSAGILYPNGELRLPTGATEPAVPQAKMLWHNGTRLKIRNDGNTAWLDVDGTENWPFPYFISAAQSDFFSFSGVNGTFSDVFSMPLWIPSGITKIVVPLWFNAGGSPAPQIRLRLIGGSTQTGAVQSSQTGTYALKTMEIASVNADNTGVLATLAVQLDRNAKIARVQNPASPSNATDQILNAYFERVVT